MSHVFRVRDWEFYFSRRASDPKSKWEHGAVSEIATLTLVGDIVRPGECKYKVGRLTFDGKSDLLDHEAVAKRVAIGSATARGEEVEGYLFVSEERLKLLFTAAQSGKIEVAQFIGPKLRYGSGLIYSISVDTHFDENEW